ncbi:hypothetical protein ACH79_10900 [Bradyrhizobium sp. CCBAU 051011]|uniref:hypothetical protein n=1 Tax=Bradyrhizobium sp. CCBAU 051011 TaxID=858422 RepID=UPI0013738EBB|nr:hypothetical protein [Bradyrhizobium sp. CCBAU 051011]QHO73072.1 hypothetical protein ACH79_10900 [Bradyrhizobium sp. CCBAU 051011]
MRKLLGLVVMIVSAAISTADSASAKKMKQVLEARMACAKAPPNLTIGPKFLSHVKRMCEGKTECSVGPGELFAAGDMERWGCNKGFFVLISCGGSDKQQYPSDNVKQKIDVFCDAP